MEKKEILSRLNNLNNKIQNINNWIRNNPEVSDPNMYEIMSCWCEYGEFVHLLNNYYDTHGWPELNGEKASHYEIWKLDEEARNCRFGLRDMEQLRNLDDHEFLADENISDLFVEVCARASIGEYDVPTDPAIAALKKETLCKSMSIPFYIWQVRRNNPDYQYDNETEWNSVLESYQLYKDAVGVQTRSYTCVNNSLNLEYEGPQFGKEIESVIKSVDKNYKYSNENSKKLEKK